MGIGHAPEGDDIRQVRLFLREVVPIRSEVARFKRSRQLWGSDHPADVMRNMIFLQHDNFVQATKGVHNGQRP